MSPGQRGEAAIQALDEILLRLAGAAGPMSDRLHDRQRILDPVRQLAKQQSLLHLPGLSFTHIPGAFEGELLSLDCFEDDAALDRQLPTILGLVLQLAAPAAFIEQLDTHLTE